MRDGETVGLFLLAREEGMGFAEAAEFAGVAPPDRREVGRRAAAALRSRRALQMARLGRAVPREPPGEEHVPQGQELRQRPHGGLLRHAQVGVLPQPGLGGGRPERLHGRAAPLAQVVPVGPRVGVARLEDAGREPQAPGLRGVGCTGKRPRSRNGCTCNLSRAPRASWPPVSSVGFISEYAVHRRSAC